MHLRRLMISTIAAVLVAGTASAATLSGLFNVTAVNVTNLNSAESQATYPNYFAALADTLGGADSDSVSDSFTYDGALNFNIGRPQTAAFTVANWLATGSGTVSGLDAALGGLQLSYPNINSNPGSATTTFFRFRLVPELTAGTFKVRHDDGMVIADDGVVIGGFVGPNGARNTTVTGFDGGALELLYVATNGNPSILIVDTDAQVVPVPAALPLLLAGLGGLALVGRRRGAAA